MDKQDKKTNPLGAFVEHQINMIEETGKAVVSLLPKDFRTHTGRAIEEGKAGFEALFDGILDGVQGGVDKLRKSSKDESGDKVKVEVE